MPKKSHNKRYRSYIVVKENSETERPLPYVNETNSTDNYSNELNPSNESNEVKSNQ